MKIATKQLREAFGHVSKICTGRSTLPILATVLLEAKGGRLSMTCTDMDMRATARCDCDGDLEPICVAGFAFGALLSGAGETVTLEVRPNLRLAFESNARSTLACEDAKMFPTLEDSGAKALGVNTEDLATLLASVQWAASPKPEGSPMVDGVCVRCDPKTMSAMATDGKLCAYHEMPRISSKCDFMVLSSAAPLLCEALKRPDSTAALSNRHFSVRSEGLDVAAKLMEGNFFDIKGRIAGPTRKEIGTVDKATWLEAAQTIQMLDRGDPVNWARADITTSKTEARITYKGSNTFERAIEGVFESARFSINVALLEKALASCNTPSPALSLNEQVACFSFGDYLAFAALLRDTEKPEGDEPPPPEE